MKETFKNAHNEWLDYVTENDPEFTETGYVLWEIEEGDCFWICYTDSNDNNGIMVAQLWNEHGANYFDIYKHERQV